MSRGDPPLRSKLQRFLTSVRSGSALADNAIGVYFFAGTVVAAVGQVDLLESWLNLALSASTAVISMLYACALLFALRGALRFFATSYSVVGTLAAFMAVGAARYAFLDWLNAYVGLHPLYSDSFRVFAGAMQGLVWVGAASMYYANRDRFIKVRSEVLEEQARIELNAFRQSALAAALAQTLAETVGQKVSESVSQTRELIMDALPLEDSREALRGVVQSLRRTIDEEIRPMSHDLWDVPPAEQMALSVPTILRLGCYSRPYPLRSVLVVVLLAIAPMTLSMRFPSQALALLAVQMLLVCFTLGYFDRRVRDLNAAEAFDFWAGVVAATYVVSITPATMPNFGWTFQEAQHWAIFCSFGVVLLLVFLAIVHGLAGTWESVGARARDSLSDGDVAAQLRAREMLATSRKLARHLHTSVQGRLMALSLEIERAADEGRADYVQDALLRLDALLQAPLVGALEPGIVDLEGSLQILAEEWSAIADVHLTVLLPDEVPLANRELVHGIAEEAIANAVRHGGASRVDIAVLGEGHDVCVRAINDGRAPGPGRSGLGSRWLDTISPESWTLQATADGRGSVLEVRLRDALETGVHQ